MALAVKKSERLRLVTTIAIDARELRTSTGRYVERLLHYLQQIDHDHDYIVLLKPKDFDGWIPTSPNFRTVPCPHKEFSLAEQTALKKQLDELKPDLVHFPMVQQPIFYRGLVVTTMQDLTTIRFRNPTKNPAVFWLKQRVYKFVNVRVAHKSHLLITPTEFVKKDVARYCHVPLSKITVTLEAADMMPEGSSPYKPVEGKPFIMYLGRPTPHKNLGRLIEAHQKLREAHPDLLLVLAGKKDANYQLHEKTVQEKGYEGVIFTDYIPDDQFRWLLEHCRAYCFPSLSEGFGLPGLEAMLHGAPVVASNATCIPEVLGDAAVYFNPLDVDDIAAKIASVISNEARRSKMIAAGKRQAAKYSWERMARQTLEVYNQTLQT